ncbi:hypothetical protein TcWFU_003159 [Taenia crassiceps]|uniref:PID domain-containing protein n=1 Tax=Taenia crassiceps TaxID=6207 RepID=A0ABR4Q463_9CEST
MAETRMYRRIPLAGEMGAHLFCMCSLQPASKEITGLPTSYIIFICRDRVSVFPYVYVQVSNILKADNEAGRRHCYYMKVCTRVLRSYAAAIAACLPTSLRVAANHPSHGEASVIPHESQRCCPTDSWACERDAKGRESERAGAGQEPRDGDGKVRPLTSSSRAPLHLTLDESSDLGEGMVCPHPGSTAHGLGRCSSAFD